MTLTRRWGPQEYGKKKHLLLILQKESNASFSTLGREKTSSPLPSFAVSRVENCDNCLIEYSGIMVKLNIYTLLDYSILLILKWVPKETGTEMSIVALSAGQKLDVSPILMRQIDMGKCIGESYSNQNQQIMSIEVHGPVMKIEHLVKEKVWE